MTASNGSEAPQTTTYGYDAANRRTSETYPDDVGGLNVRFFTYDDVDNVASRTDQNGDTTYYAYDDLHRAGKGVRMSLQSHISQPISQDSYYFWRSSAEHDDVEL